MILNFIFFLLSYLVYRKIWLNLLVGDCQFGFITKLKKENPGKKSTNYMVLGECDFLPNSGVAY